MNLGEEQSSAISINRLFIFIQLFPGILFLNIALLLIMNVPTTSTTAKAISSKRLEREIQMLINDPGPGVAIVVVKSDGCYNNYYYCCCC